MRSPKQFHLLTDAEHLLIIASVARRRADGLTVLLLSPLCVTLRHDRYRMPLRRCMRSTTRANLPFSELTVINEMR